MILIQQKTRELFDLFQKKDRVLELSLLFIFFVLGLIGILNHAMWRDELNGWLIARDSYRIYELFSHVKYEGHPLLWYLCLDLLNRVTHNPVAMQILHLFIATGAAYLFIRFSPFTNLQKILFLFGYLPFYEYLLISRNYAIGLLTIFLFCFCFESRQKSYLRLSLILALMANTNAYCLLIAIALTIVLTLEYFWKEKLNYKSTASKLNIIISLLIFFIGVSISVATLIPPIDSNLQGGATEWMLQFDLVQLARTITRIWNSYILILVPADSKPLDLLIFTLFSLGILAFATTIFIRKPITLLFYLIANLEILTFTYVKFLGSARHYGHFYIILIVSLWLASYHSPSELLIHLSTKLPSKINSAIANWINFVSRYKTTFIIIILYVQLIAGIIAFSRELFIPYSASRKTANYIQSHHLEKMFIIGSEDFAISPICAYLNRKIYYPESQKFGSFVLFNSQRQSTNIDKILEQVSTISQEKEQDILLILNYEIQNSRNDLKLSLLKKFTNSFIHNEKYYLYIASKNI
ncbi:hypothetical protein Ple7327_2879 [Pleurocapsa sp. PCC 7327]|uniref:hypothetical protein n=1 Tax=Pleurocapsa sp. PCC 7327 TaxID=118163 RepID=UPI00029F9B9C|nr:hypothetical protein [Pleurocapsa sp. PCC 7327]AFY78133.1 hypothetical protein Ple7327_2879 [Pleurocapsa sp. PCC 7327]